MHFTKTQISDFRSTLYAHYRLYGRHDLPWRRPEADGSFDAYKILVSELMLQQTQGPRVIPKYREFLSRFPTAQSLAEAQLKDVLIAWSGLGYNRRAKYLHDAAKQIARSGTFPDTITELVKLPGVGHNTAGAILAYAFNRPALFIETNIRTVFIHHSFKDQSQVADQEITTLLKEVIDTENPREFYWALMDYGSHLKQTVGSLNEQTKGYVRQLKFEGSKRQIRGRVLRLLSKGPCTANELAQSIADERLPEVLTILIQENLVQKSGQSYHL